jgi:hypothetical protein
VHTIINVVKSHGFVLLAIVMVVVRLFVVLVVLKVVVVTVVVEVVVVEVVDFVKVVVVVVIAPAIVATVAPATVVVVVVVVVVTPTGNIGAAVDDAPEEPIDAGFVAAASVVVAVAETLNVQNVFEVIASDCGRQYNVPIATPYPKFQ